MKREDFEHAAVLIGCGESGDPAPPEVIGSKAHNLARMARLGLPVPPAFVLPTSWCAQHEALTPAAWESALRRLEACTGLAFGDARRPLLLAVRSGAPVSMPGMMETVLNIGLNDRTVQGLVRLTGNPRLAWDAYRRLISGFAQVVLGLPPEPFEADEAAVASGRDAQDLDFDEFRAVTRAHLNTVLRLTGKPFPQDPQRQLALAIGAVFASWSADKARTYRRLKQLDDAMGTAVTVQRMVFGNAGGASGSGVGFTRHPSTGEPAPWVDFLFNAQGEDVVSGRRSAGGHAALAELLPLAWHGLLDVVHQLERAFGDMQDFEFTVEGGHLFILQTRAGKRTPVAAARIALDLLEAGVIDRDTALERTQGLDGASLSVARLAPGDGAEGLTLLARGQSACDGVASGELAFDEARVAARRQAGAAVLLVRQDAETRDIAALEQAQGLLTVRGARTSHAAVVARQLGKVCIVGCESLQIDAQARRLHAGERVIAEGECVTLDGHSGDVYLGQGCLVHEVPAGLLQRLQALRGQ